MNQLRDPLLEASQVGFSYFAEWWKAEQDIKQQRDRQKNGGRRPEPVKESHSEQRSKIQNAYDQYKLNWNTRMAKLFVHGHKYDTWFRERYVPEVRDPLRQKVLDFRRDLFARWDSDLTAGTFDEFTLEGIYKSESNGAGGIVEREEGETSAAAEVLAVSDLLPSKGGDVRDPVAFQPTLLVKTITPAVSRERMEEFCKEHLGEGEGGYKWLSLSDPNPGKKFHRLGWIMLNPASDVPEEDSKRRGSRDDDDQDAEGGAMDQDKKRETIRTIWAIQKPRDGDASMNNEMLSTRSVEGEGTDRDGRCCSALTTRCTAEGVGANYAKPLYPDRHGPAVVASFRGESYSSTRAKTLPFHHQVN